MTKPLALVVEDDADVAELYTHLLRLLGFETAIVDSGGRAYTRMQESVPNLLILDLRLKGELSGRKLLERIDEDDRLVDMLRIVISGYPWLAEGIGDRADMVLLKPVDIRQLATLIQRLHIGNTNLLPAELDPLGSRVLDQAEFAERTGYNLERGSSHPDYRFAMICLWMERVEPEGALDAEIEERLKSEMVRRMRRRLRLVDLVTTVAEKDYLVLLHQIKENDNAVQVARRLVSVLEQPFIFEDGQFVHDVTAGVVLSTPEATGPEEMIRLAQSALEKAVESGQEVLLHGGMDTPGVKE